MKDIEYQQEYIKELSDKIVKLLSIDKAHQKVVFKAPTGSGKTYMAAMAMEKVADELHNDPRHFYNSIAYVWIAPNRLHSQAYNSFVRLFAETRALNPIRFGDIPDAKLHHGDILCLNWDSINSDDNVLVRKSESGASLWDIIDNTRLDNTAIVAVIDEEHLHYSETASRAAIVLERLRPIVEVRVSATPKTPNPAEKVEVPRDRVIEAQMIKKGIIINPDIVSSKEAEVYLLNEALNKRNQIAQCYADLGRNINPLLLIQLPNDTLQLTAEEKTLRDQITGYLKGRHQISVESKELAIWLSDKDNKINLEEIERKDSPVKVLIFKEAIAKGWDCPRAAVLLIFRKLHDSSFAIQTLGRILRMPEQRHYDESLLDYGYVYTNIQSSEIAVTGEAEDYWKQIPITATRRANLNNITLESVYELYPVSGRNRLGSDFGLFLYAYINRYWFRSDMPTPTPCLDSKGNMALGAVVLPGSEDTVANIQAAENNHNIHLEVKGTGISVPRNVTVRNEEDEKVVVKEQVEFAYSNDRLHKVFLVYCGTLLTQFDKTSGTPILAAAIFDAMEWVFGLNQWDSMRVILAVDPFDNKTKFTDLFSRALEEYYAIVMARKAASQERSFEKRSWEVPEKRIYNALNNTAVDSVGNHALNPYVKLNEERIQEDSFVEFLEKNSDYIDWWYKNGDKGSMHYAIEYYDPEKKCKRLFYVDFIIRLKNGDVYLFDTKGSKEGGDKEPEAVLCAKHNALIDYISANNIKGGGIIKNHGGVWRYYPGVINSLDTRDWIPFFPDQLSGSEMANASV